MNSYTDSMMLLPMFEGQNSLGRMMLKRISSVNIAFAPAADAFDDIVSSSAGNSAITLCDILAFDDILQAHANPYARDGQSVIVISGRAPDTSAALDILKHSVSGIYRLVSRTNGFCISLTEDELAAVEGARFYFCDRNKAKMKEKLFRSWGMYAHEAGVAGGGRICVFVGDEPRMDAPKSEFCSESAMYRVDIAPEHALYFDKSYDETVRYSLLAAACMSKCLDIGHGGDMASLLASLLGIHAAHSECGMRSFVPAFHTGYTVAVPYGGKAAHGMTVSLFNPTDRITGKISRTPLDNICRVLRGLAEHGEICIALPYEGSIEQSLAPVLGDGDIFVKDAYPPETVGKSAVITLGYRAAYGTGVGHIEHIGAEKI